MARADAGPAGSADPPGAGEAPGPLEVADLRAARDRVLGRIGDACVHAGRDPTEVTLVAVSKTVPPERLRAAVAAGLRLFGENRVQEAAVKVGAVPGARWHLIGPLQANKAGRAAGLFEVVETVDSVALARRLDRLVRETPGPAEGSVVVGRRLPVLLQVNVDRDPAKSGFLPESLEPALAELAGLGSLQLDGLMTVGRLVERAEEARSTFVALRRLSERLRSEAPALGGALSMGMSADFEVAIAEGATIVRIGSALFGPRAVAR